MSYTLAAFADEAGSSLTAQIAALQRNGIGLLEIRGVDGKSIADVDAGEAKEIARRLADAGLAVRSIGSPYGKIGINDDFGPHFEKFPPEQPTTAFIPNASCAGWCSWRSRPVPRA